MSLCGSVSFSVPLSFSLTLSLCISVCSSVLLSLSISLPVSVFVSIAPCLSLSPSLSFLVSLSPFCPLLSLSPPPPLTDLELEGRGQVRGSGLGWAHPPPHPPASPHHSQRPAPCPQDFVQELLVKLRGLHKQPGLRQPSPSGDRSLSPLQDRARTLLP